MYENVPGGGVRGHSLQVGNAGCMALSPGGKLLAVGGETNGIDIWNLTTKKKIGSLTGLSSPPAGLSFAADGSALAAADMGGTTFRVWDVASQRTRRQIIHNRGQVGFLALSPNGKLLATTGPGHNVLLLWNVATRELPRQGPPLELSAEELADLWTDLADKDYGRCDAAWRKLAAAGDNAIPFLKERIRPIAVPPLDRKRVERLLADLDSDHFVTREKATRDLTSLGELAIIPLQRFMKKPSSVESDRRAHLIFKNLSEPVPTPDRLRTLEVLELLEQLRSPRAVALLQEIGRDALVPQIWREAGQAARRAAAACEEKK
jgi:WD40 repeat protein